MTGISLLLAAVVGLLFYRWVDRHHKILIAKLLVGVVTLLGLAIAVFVWLDHATSRRRNRLLTSISGSAHHDSSSGISFGVCNSHSATLERYRFDVSGYEAGRSSPHVLLGETTSWDTSTNFTSDIVIRPGACSIIRWPGEYAGFDSIGIRASGVRFADGSESGYFSP